MKQAPDVQQLQDRILENIRFIDNIEVLQALDDIIKRWKELKTLT